MSNTIFKCDKCGSNICFQHEAYCMICPVYNEWYRKNK